MIPLNEQQRWETYLRTCAPNEDSDQPAHLLSLIRISTWRISDSQGCRVFSCGQRTLNRLGGCPDWFESSLGSRQKIRFLTLRLICAFYLLLNWDINIFNELDSVIIGFWTKKLAVHCRKLTDMNICYLCCHRKQDGPPFRFKCKSSIAQTLIILTGKESQSIKNSDIFLVAAQNIDCGYSLEPPRRGGSNEYPQSMFWAEIRKIMYTPVNSRFTI